MGERIVKVTVLEQPRKMVKVGIARPPSEILKDAAPDLLEACKAVLEWQRAFFKLDFELEKKLRRAIDKAEGIKERRPRRSRKGG